MFGMKEEDLTKCQRMKDSDRVWAAIYCHKFHNLLERLWNSLKRRIRETSSNNGRQNRGRRRQETGRKRNQVEIMSNEQRELFAFMKSLHSVHVYLLLIC